MRINIASSGRFHVCDLAKELIENGHEVRFYSYVPSKRLMKFGLPKESSYSLFFLMLPVLFLVKLTRRAEWVTKLEWFILDHLVAWYMKPCDIFIAMSSIYIYSFKYVKKKYNCITILERGSNHTLEIKEIFEKSPNNVKMKNNFALNSSYVVKRELESYKMVDYIALASNHVKTDFIRRGVPENKLFVNPYGVNLSMFNSTRLEDNEIFDILMVGNWCWRKGCDILIEACKSLNLKVLHVGSITDVNFPKSQNFIDIGTIDQSELVKYYKKAKVFVLPSREDGFGMVLTQAAVCGLPIVCSKNTGGAMIKALLTNDKWISIMDETNKESLIKSIKQALLMANEQKGVRDYASNIIGQLSWQSYGNRYDEFLKNKNNHI